ncbi:MAG TPA: ABC transporter substrate-binding protein, partial [Bacillota bacterium]|nr:ABC transporter substrate-binding protein [Bacillota bacterium]
MTNTFALPRRSFLAIPLGVAAVSAAGCGFSGSQDNGGTGPDGTDPTTTTLRQANRPVNHLNPAFGGGGSPQSTWLMSMIWEGLINRKTDKPSEYIPAVAEEWEVSDDGLTYTFHLRDGLTWSNGDPLTAEDFVWSYSYYYSPALAEQDNENEPSHKGNVESTKIAGMADYYSGKVSDFSTVGVKAIDDTTLEITLFEPDYSMLNGLDGFYPLHRTSVEADQKAFWMPENLVANGPYVMTDYTQ